MKAVLVLFSITLLLFFQQLSAEESKDASISREVRSAGVGKIDTRPKKGKKKCRGKKCNKNGQKGKRSGKEKGKKEDKKLKGKTGRRKRVRGRKGKKGKGKKGRKIKVRGAKNKKGKGKKGKETKTKFSGKQTSNVPAKCTADTCSNTDYVNLFNKYKQYDNVRRQLKRLTKFYGVIRNKAALALTTFQPAKEAISASTNDCTFCADPNVSSPALSNCTLLQNCSVSAPAVCNTNNITFAKVKTDCPSPTNDTCPAATPNKEQSCSDGCPITPTTGPPLCTDVCKDSGTDQAALTDADVTYADETCLPLLSNWTKQYRDCNAGDTFKCTQSGCNTEKGTCNLENCRCAESDGLVARTCDFEECVMAKNTTGSEYKDFVCNTCLKKLNELLDIPARCLTLAKYERAVYARKEECIRRNIAGSFGDCLASKNAIIPFILECSSCIITPTTVAPTGRLAALKKKSMKKLW